MDDHPLPNVYSLCTFFNSLARRVWRSAGFGNYLWNQFVHSRMLGKCKMVVRHKEPSVSWSRFGSQHHKSDVEKIPCWACHLFDCNRAVLRNSNLQGDSVADLQFPAKVGTKLVREGYVSPHHIIPKSGWVSHEIQNAKDVEAVVELFRFQCNRLVKSK